MHRLDSATAAVGDGSGVVRRRNKLWRATRTLLAATTIVAILAGCGTRTTHSSTSVSLSSFGRWTFQQLGQSGAVYTGGGTFPNSQLEFALPPGTSEGGTSGWWILHLHLRVAVNPTLKVASASYIAASSNQVGVAYVRVVVARGPTGLVTQWTSVGDVDGVVQRSDKGKTSLDIWFNNYFPIDGARPGQNVIQLIVGHPHDVFKRVEFAGDSVIEHTRNSPGKLVVSLTTGNRVHGRVVLTMALRDFGGDAVRNLHVEIRNNRRFYKVVGPSRRDISQLRAGSQRTIRFSVEPIAHTGVPVIVDFASSAGTSSQIVFVKK